eukprot:GEMP01081213.1.p2 GENE.GEMP01081213.1~~GEMP01081213.1.p2  ORF type:complete len:114 (-),score=15.78 GEMP01081213.1:328-669(-)
MVQEVLRFFVSGIRCLSPPLFGQFPVTSLQEPAVHPHRFSHAVLRRLTCKRFCMARTFPLAAASPNKNCALVRFLSTMSPVRNCTPKRYCASASPNKAAFLSHLIAPVSFQLM